MPTYTDRLHEMLTRHEGKVPHMYLDSRGNVTAGVGFHLHTPAVCATREWLRSDGSKATGDQVEAEWKHIKSLSAAKTVAFYKDHCTLCLSDAEIDRMLSFSLEGFDELLTAEFHDWLSFPEDARLAVMDMAYSLGFHGMVKKFPKFCAAVRLQDWTMAGNECRRGGISDRRNHETFDLFADAELSVIPEPEMEEPVVRLERFCEHPLVGTFGTLVLPCHADPDGPPLLWTCENPWHSNARYVSCIPAGTYRAEPSFYRRGGYDSWEIQDVPGRSLIKVHRGNTMADTSGCILPGLRLGASSVVESAKAFKVMMDELDGAAFTLEISWRTPPL